MNDRTNRRSNFSSIFALGCVILLVALLFDMSRSSTSSAPAAALAALHSMDGDAVPSTLGPLTEPFELPDLPRPLDDPYCGDLCLPRPLHPQPQPLPGPDPGDFCAGLDCCVGPSCGFGVAMWLPGCGSGNDGVPCLSIYGCDPIPLDEPDLPLKIPPTPEPPDMPYMAGAGVATTAPVNPVYGSKHERSIDLIVHVSGRPFIMTRSYSSDPGLLGPHLVGTNWSMNVFRFLHKVDATSTSPLEFQDISSGTRTYTHDGNGKWKLAVESDQFIEKGSVEIDGDKWPVYWLVQPGSWEMAFLRENEESETPENDWKTTPQSQYGLAIQNRDLYGNIHTFDYDDSGNHARLSTIYLNGEDDSDCEASVHFDWVGSGENIGKLEEVTVKRYPTGGPIEVAKIAYTYKQSADGLSDDIGGVGNLIQVAKSMLVDRAPSGVDPWYETVQQYRYHTTDSGEISGADMQLKMVFQPQQIEFAAQENYEQLSTTGTVLDFANSLLEKDDSATAYSVGLEDIAVEDLAAKIIGYESGGDRRVAVQYVQSGCGCASTQHVRIDYEYIDDFSGLQDPQYDRTTVLTFNRWDDPSFTPYLVEYYDVIEKTVQSQSQHLIQNIARQELDEFGVRTGPIWVRCVEFDAEHRPHRLYNPSAITSYTPATAAPTEPDVDTDAAEGLVLEYTYTSDGYIEKIFVVEDEIGTKSLMREQTYDSNRPWLVTKMEISELEGQSAMPGAGDRQTLEYNYEFHQGDAISCIEVVVAAETSSENGIVDASLYQHSFFNEKGQEHWTRMTDGSLRRREFDDATGWLTVLEINADGDTAPSCSTCDYSGSFDGRHSEGGSLIYTYGYSDDGRIRKVTEPDGVTTRFTHELRFLDMSMDQCGSQYEDDRPGIVFLTSVVLPEAYVEDSATKFAGPASVAWYDATSRGIAFVDYTMTEGGSGKYDDIFPQEYEHSFACDDHVSRSTVTHALSGEVLKSTVWHDVDGVGDNDGRYITEYKYDQLGRLEQVIAPNDSVTKYVRDVLGRVVEVHEGTTAGVLPVSSIEYDSGGAGDGNITSTLAFTGEDPQHEPDERSATLHYDKRNRLVAIENEESPHIVIAYDNLGRVSKFAIYSALPSDFDDIDLQTDSDREVYGEVLYNRRGQPYREKMAINAGDLGDGFLESNSWYDEGGFLVSQSSPNSPAAKMLYDALGRVTSAFAVAMGGDPADLPDDIVFEQAEFSYRADANLLELITTRVRTHDAPESLKGDLSTWSGSDADMAITSYSGLEYDAVGRVTRSLEFGTRHADGFASGGTAPQLDSSTPPKWNTTGSEITTRVVYDAQGRIDRVIDPLERETALWYDDLGRRIAVVENHVSSGLNIIWDVTNKRWEVQNASTESDEDRVTSFVHRITENIFEQVAHTFDGSTPKVQVTRYQYGVTEGDGDDESRITSNDLLAQIIYPDRDTGLPTTDTENRVRFAYNRLGEVRYTQDQNDTSHTYTRDVMGRVTLDVAQFAQGSPIDDFIDRIKVTYDALGRPKFVESLSDASTVENAVEFVYTSLGQIAQIKQEHFGGVTGATPYVEYLYDTQNSSSGNYSRPVSMEYPTTETLLEAVYNTAGQGQPPSVDHVISRLRAMKFDDEEVVAYDFIGLMMPAVVSMPVPDVELNYWLKHNASGSTGKYAGYDRFGRITSQKWVDGDYGYQGPHSTKGSYPSIPPIVELAYTYDRVGNIIEKYDDRPGATQALNHRYVYDDLDRLIEAKRGSGSGGNFTQATGSQEWGLDHLGNHLAFNTDLDGDGDYVANDDLLLAGDFNFANEVEQITRTKEGQNPVQLPFAYDDAGNLSEKSLNVGKSLLFIHDAWNRLVRIERDTGSTPVPLAEYRYNGLHQRLYKRVDTSLSAQDPGYGEYDTQHRFFYSAGWQIIEELIDEGWDEQSMPSVDRTVEYVWGARYIDDIVMRAVTDHGESTLEMYYHLTDHQFSTVALIDSEANLLERVTYDAYGMARHHWAADLTGDGAVNVDDRAAMNAALNESIGDQDYNVDADVTRTGRVTMTDAAHTGTSQYKAALPKGDLSGAAASGGGGWNTIGYCGYVFNPEVPTTGGGGGLYTVRFRHYDAEIGRWLERDPLGYVDGMNLYGYAMGSPVVFSDPFGLESDDDEKKKSWWQRLREKVKGAVDKAKQAISDWWEEMTEGAQALGEMVVEAVTMVVEAVTAAVENPGEFFKGVAFGLFVAAAVAIVVAAIAALSPIAGTIAVVALVAVTAYGIYTVVRDWDELSDGEKAFVLGTFLAAPFGYKGGGRFARWFRGRARAGCFLAGTLVATASGMTPIEQVEPGDEVWSYDQETQEWVLREVERVFEHEYFGDIVTLTVEHEDGLTETIEATGGHPFWVVEGEGLADRPNVTELPSHESALTPSGRWTEARWLRLGDHFLTRTGKSATVAGLTIRIERVKVYNLQVADLHLYAVGEHGVLVHNSQVRYIGRTKDLDKLPVRLQRYRLDRYFEVVEGNPWMTAFNNLRALRLAIRRGYRIKDISPNDNTGPWLNQERIWLESCR